MPEGVRRMPSSGSSAISTSAIMLLVVASQPGKSMPAALRTRLRPPSHPTRYCARSDWPSESATSTPVVVLRESGDLDAVLDRHPQLADPAGQDALDVVLPQPEPVGVAGRKVADVQTDAARTPRPGPPAPPRETDRRCRADRGSRSCASADRRRASRRGPGWRAARQWRRRRPPAPARLPTSAPSDRLRRRPRRAQSSPPSASHAGSRVPRGRRRPASPTSGCGPRHG